MNISKYVAQLNAEVNSMSYKQAKKNELKLAKKYFMHLNVEDQFSLLEKLFDQPDYVLFSIATIWIKNNTELIDIEFYPFYERCLINSIASWYTCDQYCYRVLNPMIEKYPELLNYVLKWTHSDKIYVKRASAVCLIHSSSDFSINVPCDIILDVCEALLNETHLHIRKGMGWLLKYSYLSYPEAIVHFLKQHVTDLNSVSFAYALEKMPNELKEELRKLRYKHPM